MKLLIQPFFEADPLHAFDIAGPWAESQAIQRVQDLLVFRKLFLEQFGVIGGFARFAAGGGWEGKKNAAEGRGQESTASLHEPITIKRHSGSEVYKEFHLALLILLTMCYLTNTL
jgi:hypothetical protein